MKGKKQLISLSFIIILIVTGFLADMKGSHLTVVNKQLNPFYNNSAEAALLTEARKKNDSSIKTLIGEGKASFYSNQFHGHTTANGENFNIHQLTAAHPSLPFGTWVRVTNLRTGKDVVVRINDRGPFTKGRIIDLSKGAAKELGILKSGTAQVKLETLGIEDNRVMTD